MVAYDLRVRFYNLDEGTHGSGTNAPAFWYLSGHQSQRWNAPQVRGSWSWRGKPPWLTWPRPTLQVDCPKVWTKAEAKVNLNGNRVLCRYCNEDDESYSHDSYQDEKKGRPYVGLFANDEQQDEDVSQEFADEEVEEWEATALNALGDFAEKHPEVDHSWSLPHWLPSGRPKTRERAKAKENQRSSFTAATWPWNKRRAKLAEIDPSRKHTLWRRWPVGWWPSQRLPWLPTSLNPQTVMGLCDPDPQAWRDTDCFDGLLSRRLRNQSRSNCLPTTSFWPAKHYFSVERRDVWKYPFRECPPWTRRPW